MAAGETEVWAELRYARKRVPVKEKPGVVVANKRVLLGRFKVAVSDAPEERGPGAKRDDRAAAAAPDKPED
jgi:hypothetical protein